MTDHPPLANRSTADDATSGAEIQPTAVARLQPPAVATLQHPAVVRLQRLGWGRLIWRRFRRHRLALTGLIGLLLLSLLALIGPQLVPWHYLDIDPTAFLQPPGSSHLLGTTQAGRDVLALTLHGLGRSLLIGLIAAGLQTALAAVVGSAAAFFGGWLERLALWLIDLLLIIPSFLIVATLMRGQVTGPASWLILACLLAAFGWMLTGRVVRSLTLSLKNQDFIRAARYLGQPNWRIVTKHILPNLASLMIIDLTLNIGYAILAEAGLSFLGFGVAAPDTALGRLIGEGAGQVTSHPWIFVSPAIGLTLLVLSVNAIGDGLRDALDPSATGWASRRPRPTSRPPDQPRSGGADAQHP